MKKLALLTAAALSLTFGFAASAQEEGREEDEPSKPVKLPNPKDMPSKKKPPAKNCSDQCRYDQDDCLWMCKSVPNQQGATACRKACNDNVKECVKGCNGG